MKKVFLGVAILLFGLLWYLNDTGTFVLQPFWPIIAILVGLLVLVKAAVSRPEVAKKRR